MEAYPPRVFLDSNQDTIAPATDSFFTPSFFSFPCHSLTHLLISPFLLTAPLNNQ